MMWALGLLGAVRKGLAALWALAVKYPLQAALLVALLACGWLPSLSGRSPAYRRHGHLESRGEGSPGFGASNRPNFFNIGLRKFREWMTLPLIMRAVEEFIGAVFNRGGPSQMSRIATQPIPAGMCGLMARARPLSLRGFAHVRMWGYGFFGNLHPTITVAPSERPNKAVLTHVRQRNCGEKGQRFAIRCSPPTWIPMIPKSLIVAAAKIAGSGGIATPANRAYFRGSHSVFTPRRGQGRARVQPRFRPDLHIMEPADRQGIVPC